MANKRKKSANNKKAQKLAKQTNPQSSDDSSDEETGNQNDPKFEPNAKWNQNPNHSKGLDENLFADDLGKRLVFVNQNPLDPEFDRFFDPMIDDDLNDPFMAALFPGLMGKHRFFDHNIYDHLRKGSDAQEEEYCAEIVQQLRQFTNSLIDEMKVTRKEFEEKTANATKEIVGGIKEIQSQISKALREELPKVLKDKNTISFEIISDL